ncbi:MAG: AarF/ABC1/UbiB kinase family protein [Bdellovibrionales bacterium]|nr:AarF/ABC1/UbiB kinase family protein [Bdellovibrionales bacterium]
MKNRIRSGLMERGLSLAKLGLQIGALAAVGRNGNNLLRQAELLATELGKLKGSLMKAGQMLSVYGEHFFPPEVNAALKRLQSETPPLDWKEVEKVLTKSLGKERLARLDIEHEAFAAASLGQVHRARIHATGREVAIKVQYPGVDKAIRSDVATLRTLFSLLELAPRMPELDQIFAEVQAMMRQELDYKQELRMLRFFRRELAGDSRYLIPEPIEEFSTARVLTMEYVPGAKIDGTEVAELSPARRNALGEAALDLYFQELFRFRKVQTDPHFGNYRVRIDARGKDQLVLYDFGAVRTVEASFINHYSGMLRGLLDHDQALFEKSAGALGMLQAHDPEDLRRIFSELCSLIVEPFLGNGLYSWAGTDLPRRCVDKALELKKYPLRQPPRELVFLDRKMAGMFTLEASLGAEFAPRALLERYV